ncbi:hypothetical protein FS749_001487 [Ceratobasidium sp. UAMH 11750]|nr:hypothetical protein FS749_001487 [Ceratobasidium sp. UAMH 11750]
MDAYLEAQGVDDASQLIWTDPVEGNRLLEEDKEEDNKEEVGSLEVNQVGYEEIPPHILTPNNSEEVFKTLSRDLGLVSLGYLAYSLDHTPISTSTPLFYSMYTLNPRNSGSLSQSQLVECSAYHNALNDHRLGLCEHPGVEPRSYQLYRAIMMAGANASLNPGDPSPSLPTRTRFTTSEDGHVVDATGQALLALAEAQQEIRRLLLDRSAGPNRWSGVNLTRRTGIDVDLPAIPDGFTGRIGTSLASRIGAPTAPRRVGWVKHPDGDRVPVYSNKTKRFQPFHRGKPSTRGRKKTSRGGLRSTSSPSLPAVTQTSSPAEPSVSPIEVDKPSPSEATGTSNSNTGGVADGALADAHVLDFEDDGWNIQGYEEW